MRQDVDLKELATESILELIAEAEADLSEYRDELNRRKGDEILKLSINAIHALLSTTPVEG